MAGGVACAVAVLLLARASSACPKECSCDGRSQVVDCRGRGLYDIPRQLEAETRELYLQGNRIRGLGSMAFRETPDLRVLDLANNSITLVSPSALLGLRSLRSLNLANNSIRELDRRVLASARNLTQLDLSGNSIGGLPGPLAESFGQLRRLALAHNRLQKLERPHLDALHRLEELGLRGNPWRCDCQLIGLKLWLESFVFKGGMVDEVTCSQPPVMKDRDLQEVPYDLFHACMATSYNYLFANIHHLEAEHRVLRGGGLASDAGGLGGGGDGGPPAALPECEAKQRPRPVNLRHAIATVVITGVVCGIVFLMMLAAAVYGCAYAAIMAKYQRELRKAEQAAAAATATAAVATATTASQERAGREKEPLENAIA